jgi:hypothetical protein
VRRTSALLSVALRKRRQVNRGDRDCSRAPPAHRAMTQQRMGACRGSTRTRHAETSARRSEAAVRVRRDVHRVHRFEELFDPRKRHPVKAADAEWCQPVFVLNLPNPRSTRERADGQAERLLLAWTGLRCRHGRATESVAYGRPRVRSRPWRRLSPRPDGEDRERRRSQLVFDGRRALSRTRERDRQD